MSLSKQEKAVFNKLLAKLDNEQRLDLFEELNYVIEKTNNKNYIIEECPHCHSKHIIKKGKNDNRQKYKCKDCNTHFRDTNNTILFKSRKDLNIWTKYLKCFIDRRSLRETAEICDISLPTAFGWRHKILDILSTMMNDVKLNGIVESDETYTAISYKGNHKKSKTFKMPREPHKRGGEIHLRGLSKEQVCISCSINKENIAYSKVSNLGMPKWENIYNILNKHIVKNSILVTDSGKFYNKVIDKLGVNHIPIPENQYTNGTFNIQKINSYHSYFKDLINHNFRGVSTKYLNNYLVYYNFIHCRKNERNKKITDLKEYIFNTKCNDLLKGIKRPAIPA